MHFFLLDLVGNCDTGILRLLDDESKLIKPSIENFNENIHKHWAQSKVLLKKSHMLHFTVRHFAGDVEYDSVNITQLHSSTEKNVSKCVMNIFLFQQIIIISFSYFPDSICWEKHRATLSWNTGTVRNVHRPNWFWILPKWISETNQFRRTKCEESVDDSPEFNSKDGK